MACNDRQITQADREAAYQQQRTGVMRALRPFSGTPSVENLIDYLNRELGPLIGAMRNATNTVFNHAVDNAPSANPLGFYFSTATAAADPTTGRIRLNQATQNTATIIRVSQTNGRLLDVAPWLDVMAGGPTSPLGVVTLYDSVNPGRFLRFDLNTMTDQGAYWDLGVTIVESSHASPFVDDEAVVIAFIAGVSAAGSTVPVGSLSPIATDTFVGNISGSTAAPVAVPLADVDSTSIIYDATSHTFQRAALTGAVSATQNSNATLFAGIRDNGSAENDRTNLNFLSTISNVAVVTDDSGSDELEITVERAALSGAIVATQSSNATLFAGIRDNGSAEIDRTNLNFVSTTSIISDVGQDAGNDEMEINMQRAAMSGAITAAQNVNTTTFSGIRDNGSSETARTNINFVSTTSIISDVGQDAGNDELEVNMQRAALTGEVTASQNSNATTVVRSTDFDTTPWTGNHQFDGQFALGTITTDTSTGSINVTLGATSTRLVLSGTGTITLGTISGCAEGRVLCLEFTGTGTKTITHDATTQNAVSCPGNTDLVMVGRSGVLLVGRSGTPNWKVIGMAHDLKQGTNTWSASNTFSSSVALGARVTLTGTISPSSITSDQDDYSPTGWSTSNVVRLSSDAGGRTLTGAAAGSAGEVKLLLNVNSVASARDIWLSAEDTSSSSANRFATTSTGLQINASGGVAIIYDGTSSRWRAISPF